MFSNSIMENILSLESNDDQLRLAERFMQSFRIPKSYRVWKNFEKFGVVGIALYLRSNYVKQVGLHITTKEQIEILADIIKDKHCVEVGCGSGWLVDQPNKKSISIIGIDNICEKHFLKFRPLILSLLM